VLFALPALHGWLWLLSRRVYGAPAVLAVWGAGLVGVGVAVLNLAASVHLGSGAGWYWLELLRARTIPASLCMLVAAGAGIAVLVLLAALGRVGQPALPRVRRFLQHGVSPQALQDQARRQVTRVRARSRAIEARVGAADPAERAANRARRRVEDSRATQRRERDARRYERV
jgi:hypothetical protein